MTTIIEGPKRRDPDAPGPSVPTVEQARTKARVPDDEPLPQRYPADGLGASPSLDALRFYELYHASQSMRAQIAAFWHGEQLKAVHERLRNAGQEPEREI